MNTARHARLLGAVALVAWCALATSGPSKRAGGSLPAHAEQAVPHAVQEPGWALQVSQVEGDVTVMATPRKVTLAPGDETAVVVVVSNPLPAAATVRSIELLLPARVTAEPGGDDEPFTVEAGGRASRRFIVTAGRAAASGSLFVLIDVSAVPPEGSSVTGDRFLTAEVEVAAQASTTDLELSIVSAPSDLTDGQTDAVMTVLVRNPTAHQISRIELRPIPSMDVHLMQAVGADGCSDAATTRGAIACLEDLAPGAVELVTIGLNVDNRVRTGTQHVGIVASGSLAAPAGELPTTVSTKAEVELSVFGVDALGPLGSTSLFLLPGLLAVLTFVSFSRLAYPRTSWIPAKVDVTDAKLAAVALPVATLVYLLIWLTFGADLTKEVSTFDVLLLFVTGAGLGLAVWAVFAFTYYRAIGRRRFKAGDSPTKVLQRLSWGDGSLTRPTVPAVPGPNLRLGLGAAGKVAVCSPIVFRYTDAAQTNEDVRDAFIAALESDDIDGVIRAIGPTVTLLWRAEGVRLVDDVEGAIGRVAWLLEEPTTMTGPPTREFAPEGANSPSATASHTERDRGTDQSPRG